MKKILTTILFVTTCLVLTTGCSLFGSGKKDGSGDGLSEADLNAQREARFGEGGIPTAEGSGLFHDAPFEYNSSVVTEAGRLALDYNAKILKERPELKVQIEGHCDERGTSEFNLALGQDRARAARDVLISFGISRSRLETISYGEEVPLDTGHDESAWAKNRRVHLSPYAPEAN